MRTFINDVSFAVLSCKRSTVRNRNSPSPILLQTTLQYYAAAEEILEESEIRAANVFGNIYTMSKMATTLALTMPDTTWPFVTLPNFEHWAGGLSFELGGMISLSYGVLVQEDQEEAWNSYVVGHRPTNEQYLNVTPYIWRRVDQNGTSSKVRVTDPMPGLAEYAVMWQCVPHDPAKLNHDELSSPKFSKLVAAMKADQQGVLSEIRPHDGGYKSFFLQPIFSKLEDLSDDTDPVVDMDEDPMEARQVVGFLKAALPWDHYFYDLIAETSKGIQIVVGTECPGEAQTITYELEGADVKLLGKGDLHDSSHEDMVVQERFDPLKVFSPEGLDSSSESGSESDDNTAESDRTMSSGCNYQIRIYPSAVYRDQYRNSSPTVYTAVLVIAILSTAVVFVIYDWFVKQRQRQVVSTANRTNAIVNSLFPSSVLDRLYQDESFTQEFHDKRSGDPNRNKFARLRRAFSESVDNSYDGEMATESSASCRLSKPIADLFPSATVLFGDFVGKCEKGTRVIIAGHAAVGNDNLEGATSQLIALRKIPHKTALFAYVGFTAWSSVHEPTHVFTLLETVYDAFDTIAKRLGVFKVETIGDCCTWRMEI